MFSLCIDVGVRNLSLMLMDTTSESIILWQNIDLFPSRKCEAIKKVDGVVCGNKLKDDEDNGNKCGIHGGKHRAVGGRRRRKDCDDLEKVAMALNSAINNLVLQIKDKTIEKVHVYIERQPPKQNRMLFVSHILFGKLCEVGYVCLFVSTRAKAPFLKNYLAAHGNSYKNRKTASVQFAKKYLEDVNSPYLEFYNASSKKDDLSDTLLYCLWTCLGRKKNI